VQAFCRRRTQWGVSASLLQTRGQAMGAMLGVQQWLQCLECSSGCNACNWSLYRISISRFSVRYFCLPMNHELAITTSLCEDVSGETSDSTPSSVSCLRLVPPSLDLIGVCLANMLSLQLFARIPCMRLKILNQVSFKSSESIGS